MSTHTRFIRPDDSLIIDSDTGNVVGIKPMSGNDTEFGEGGGGNSNISVDGSGNATLEGPSGPLLNFQNSGSVQAPVYGLKAVVFPRVGNSVDLMALRGGGGELASAQWQSAWSDPEVFTDTPCIVQMVGEGARASVAVYSPSTPLTWIETRNTESRYPSEIQINATPVPSVSSDFEVPPGAGKVKVHGGSAPGSGLTLGATHDEFSSGHLHFYSGSEISTMGASVVLRPAPFPTEDDEVTPVISNFVIYAHGEGGELKIKDPTDESDILRIQGDGTKRIGFFGSNPAAKPTVTGAKGGNAALTSLLTALANLGLITNSTT